MPPLGPLAIWLSLALAQVPAAETGDEPALPELNASVLAFAQERLGQKVGDGQCTTLAVEALRQAGARAFPDDDQADGDYAWGEMVERPAEVLPGDVLQFRDAVFERSQRVRDGRRVSIVHTKRTFPHHTAVVEEVRDGGRVLVILHQNTGPDDADESERQVVQRDTLRMADLKPDGGWIRAYHPRDASGSRPRRP